MTRKLTRLNAGRSLAQTAVAAGVGEHLVRIYELSPEGVASPRKRAALGAVYAEYAAMVETETRRAG
jgi:hypothetical protein